MLYYSPATRGFYDDQVHAADAIPADAIGITVEAHAALLAAQAEGQVIGVGDDGQPVPIDPPAQPFVAPDVTARQLRLWLIGAGVALATVDAAIAALPEESRAAAQVEWEYATVYQRAHPLIAQLAPVIGLTTPEAIDDAFRAAALL